MDDEKLDDLVSYRPLGRILSINSLLSEFVLIRDGFERAGKAVPTKDDFRAVGSRSGSHLLKLITSRAATEQNVLRFGRRGANRAAGYVPSPDAKKSLVAKLLFRPLEIESAAPKSLAEHILEPDELSERVTTAFASVFGDDSLEVLRSALLEPLPPITQLPAAEFPIVFLPRPGGGDIQATPLAPAEAYVRMREVTEPYFHKREEGAPPPHRGRWLKQFVSDKTQNISSAICPRRTRFLATMPSVLARRDAELHRFVRGGAFPRWRDDAVVGAVEAYAALLDLDYSNQDIRRGRDRRADSLIRAAREFIEETLADARTEALDASGTPEGAGRGERPASRVPSVVDVILRRRWPKDGYDRARRVLTSDHFRDRLRQSERS